jgi:hypothetical protein
MCTEYDYSQVLDWWSDLLDSLILSMTTLYNSVSLSLSHTHTHMRARMLSLSLSLSTVHSHIFTSCCLVVASNGRSPLPLGFWTASSLNYQLLKAIEPQQSSNSLTHQTTALHLTELNWTQLNSTDSILLTNCPAYNVLAQTTEKSPFLCCSLIAAFMSAGMPTWSLRSYCLAMAVVYRVIT